MNRMNTCRLFSSGRFSTRRHKSKSPARTRRDASPAAALLLASRSTTGCGSLGSSIDNPALTEATFGCCVGRIGADRKGNAYLR